MVRNESEEGSYALQPNPGGAFTRWFDLAIPPTTLGKFYMEIQLKEFSDDFHFVGLYDMQVGFAGKNISTNFNRTNVELTDTESLVSTSQNLIWEDIYRETWTIISRLRIPMH